MASRPLRVAGWVATRLLYAVWVALMVATPLFGFWLASSLAAYDNATQWLSLGVGLLLFPVLPVGWDLLFVWRRNRRADTRKPILTRLDRLVLRTLIVNGVFLGIMMWRAPHTAFRALAVRGDWILDGHDGPIASRARELLLGFADHFERRWHHASDTFGTSDKPPPEPPVPPPPPPPPSPVDLAQPVKPADPNGWPLTTDVDPVVTAMPPDAQASPETVGQYLAAHVADPRARVKAIHDYIVLRLHYDQPTAALSDEEARTKRPSQEADAVFAAKTAVCEGYARLFVAIAKAAGIEAAYITGYIRDAERRVDTSGSDDAVKAALEGYLHAWNAVKLDGSWLLVDTTWDDPVSADGRETLATTYLFTPPRVFALDHLPEEPAWQLVDKPLGAGDFARQPLLNPYIGQLGVVLEEPARSQITADGDEVEITLANPFHASLAAEVQGESGACSDPGATDVHPTIRCKVPAGQHEIRLYGDPTAHAHSLRYFGAILVNRR